MCTINRSKQITDVIKIESLLTTDIMVNIEITITNKDLFLMDLIIPNTPRAILDRSRIPSKIKLA